MFCAEHFIRELIFAFGFDAFTAFHPIYVGIKIGFFTKMQRFKKSKLAFSPKCNDFL